MAQPANPENSAAGRGQENRTFEDAQTPITKKKDRVFESNSPQKLQHSAGVETPSNPKHLTFEEKNQMSEKRCPTFEDAQTPITKQKNRVRVKLAAKVAKTPRELKLRHIRDILRKS